MVDNGDSASGFATSDNDLFLSTFVDYRMEGNFGGWQHWRIWRMTINSPNDHKFVKVSSAKTLCSILNNIIKVQIRQSLFRQLCFCSEFTKVCTYQSFPLYGILHI